MPEFPAWVIVLQRVVQAVAVSVEVLAVPRLLHIVVGAEEAGGDGVVEPAVHVYQAEVVQHQGVGTVLPLQLFQLEDHLLVALAAGGEEQEQQEGGQRVLHH